MEEQRGRQYIDKLEQEASQFAALHSLFKKLVKAEEVSLNNRIKFQQKWKEIAESETIEELSSAFRAYSSATEQIINTHKECIEHLKTVIQEGLRNYPIKIKQQKRSLSSRRSHESGGSGSRSQSLNRSDEGGEAKALPKGADAEHFDQEMENYVKTQVEDIKMTLVHLINTDMHHHAVALQQLSLVVPAINKLNGRSIKSSGLE